MFIARDIARDYAAATAKNDTPPAEKISSIQAGVGKINFLLQEGLAQDQSLPTGDVRLIPPSLRESVLMDTKRALIGSYYHMKAKGAKGKESAFNLYMAHAVSAEPNALLSPAWSASRKTEALHEASLAFKSAYEESEAPDVEDCKKSYEFCRATQDAIGLGMYNYSDVSKSANKVLVHSIESDLSNVFGEPPTSIKAMRLEKKPLAGLWETITAFGNSSDKPEWMDKATSYF